MYGYLCHSDFNIKVGWCFNDTPCHHQDVFKADEGNQIWDEVNFWVGVKAEA